jgi:hypothetical protein
MVAITESMICASLGYPGFAVVPRSKTRAALLLTSQESDMDIIVTAHCVAISIHAVSRQYRYSERS